LMYIKMALDRCEYCFSHINTKYYSKNSDLEFNHLNSDHFAIFLYYLSNTIWKNAKDDMLPTKLFYLNKLMHGLDLFYSVSMPDIFLLVHPLGTILGNAHYENYFVCYQNCTVGSDDEYPTFSEGCILYAHSSVIGNCKIGKNVRFGAYSFIINTNIPDNVTVLSQYPNNRVISSNRNVINDLFKL
ncbi:hypothetical protein, partial [Treponema pedis]